MSRDSSPPPLSDDSAVGSMASSIDRQNANHAKNNATNGSEPPPAASQQSNGTSSDGIRDHEPQDEGINIIREEELAAVATRMRYNNTHLTSRSIRTYLSCFDDLDIQRFESKPDYLVNFISLGINKCPSNIQRPVSILWPDSYDKMVVELAKLDAFLINTEFKEKPIDWMLKRGLTSVPKCKQCNNDMSLKFENDTARWFCQRTQACLNLFAPIQRPSFFKDYEEVGLMKILFAIYYWSTCTQCDLLYNHLKVQPLVIHSIWRSLQNVCRAALEKSYPRFRLCNNPEDGSAGSTEISEPIDLISIKLNGTYIVCAKHPKSNRVRLGSCFPKLSYYGLVELTESWFAHGAHIRVCESKFMDLTKKRSDLKVDLVPRAQMMTKNGSFDRDSAFGYLICQLTHTFKDFDSSAITRETLKLILSEIQWRELYGTNPFDALTNIVKHIAQYGEASECYTEPSTHQDTILNTEDHIDSNYIYAEKYFYAQVEPVDSNGNAIRHFGEPANLEVPPVPVVLFLCHICGNRYESFDFSMHIIAHVEANRKENEQRDLAKKKMIECKHCFKPYRREEITTHSHLLRTDLHTIRFGCRICCLGFQDRSKFLQHMRRSHFEYETPYRCPACKYASSFQRELFIHFQEEHRHAFIMLCPFCLRAFTIHEPEKLDTIRMQKASQLVYNHILEHYVRANTHSCDRCSLSFLRDEKLSMHKMTCHNPLEIRSEKEVKLTPFIVTRTEEPFCVKAIPMELFIANKRPNLAIDEFQQAAASSANIIQARDNRGRKSKSNCDGSADGASTVTETTNDGANDGRESDSESYVTASDGLIHIRSADATNRFLAGGRGALHISKNRSSVEDQLSSERILGYMSKLKRADGVIPNQSVILTPSGYPAKCVECLEYITVDHYVAAITCRSCKYITYCPIAATKHKATKHPTVD